MRTRKRRKRESIQGFILAEHIMPGKMSALQPKKTLQKAETKTLGQTENEWDEAFIINCIVTIMQETAGTISILYFRMICM